MPNHYFKGENLSILLRLKGNNSKKLGFWGKKAANRVKRAKSV
ncbi:hypothetical protein X808_17570 [Mannheimia varigena USDA-ARS-USMARC-1296]|uniref:Uncharacterized protein n=1 Tax=Mannheimia varigena USDA-ARS-USMARC-1296 TaxID=1433287 RepID=W0QDD1_9PAST|nr:hypothetical protein X808_17570 [Mannheimia varigena USDA-ARS-USMARC-1296]